MWTRVFNPHSEVLLIIYMTSSTWGWRRRRREFGATISMDYRELTTRSTILSFYTMRLPFTAQELRRRSFRERSAQGRQWRWGHRPFKCASICGSRNEYGGDRVKQLIATWSLRTRVHKVRRWDNLWVWAMCWFMLVGNISWETAKQLGLKHRGQLLDRKSVV